MLTRITISASLAGLVLYLLSHFAIAQNTEIQPVDDSTVYPASGSQVEFRCTGGDKATIHFLGPDTIALDFIGNQHVLPRERAASGAKYSAEGVTFWNKGDEALIAIDGMEYSCNRVG